MATAGISGLGISFLPSPTAQDTISFPTTVTDHTAEPVPHQFAQHPPDQRHRSIRHTVSYDVGLNRQGWDKDAHQQQHERRHQQNVYYHRPHEQYYYPSRPEPHEQPHHHRRESEAMIRLDSESSSDGRRVRIASQAQVMGDSKYETHHLNHHLQPQHHNLSPLSDVEASPSSSFGPGPDDGNFSPMSLSSLPSSSNSLSASYPYPGPLPSQQEQRQFERCEETNRLAKSMSVLMARDGGLPHSPGMETAQSRTYPPPLDFNLPGIPLRSHSPPTTAAGPSYHQPIMTEEEPAPVATSSRLPAFLRDGRRGGGAAGGLARPQSMLELGATYQRPVPYQPPHQASSSEMFRSSTSYSGRGHEADHSDDEMDNEIGSPESVPSSAGGLQRRKLEVKIERRQQLERERLIRKREEEQMARERGEPVRRQPAREPQEEAEDEEEEGDEVHDLVGARLPGVARVGIPQRSDSIFSSAGSTVGGPSTLSRQSTLLTAGANPVRRNKELDRLLSPQKATRISQTLETLAGGGGGANDSPTPSSAASSSAMTASIRPSHQLRPHSVAPTASSSMTKATNITTPVILEQAKSSNKARVELDLVLESAMVVEGGCLKGRVEVKVRKTKDKEGEVWLGKPKLRVIGFEELPAHDARHIFYHHASSISSIDSPKGLSSPLPCFSSTPDHEGFQKGVAGQHMVPFNMRLPLGKGAKGGWKGKQGVVRYIVIASIKLKGEKGSDRSIAHFYRHVEIFPYLNPAVTLAPALKPLTASGSKALFMGGTGEVELTASIHRPTWVAGQRCYVDINVNNQSTKRIKSMTLTLTRTTTIFRPHSELQVSSTGGDPESRQSQSTKKKVAEASLEMGKKVARGVTAKGSWMGVEAGESGDFSHSLLVPVDVLTVSRGRYLEVSYSLKVSVGGSLSADVSCEIPIRIVNFVSLDPPPGHCGDAALAQAGPKTLAKSWSIDQLRPAPKSRATELRKQPMARMGSLDSLRLSDLNGGRGPSRMGAPALSRINSFDSLRTVDLPRGETSDPSSLSMARGRTESSLGTLGGDFEYGRELGAAVVGRAKDRQIQHQMSLECISSAIASATARRQIGHARSESTLRDELMPSSVEPEEWKSTYDDESSRAQEDDKYYAGGGEQHFMGDFSLNPFPSFEQDFGGETGACAELDDLDDIPDDPDCVDLSQSQQHRSYLELGDDSEDEIDAMLEHSPINDGEEGPSSTAILRPRSSSLRPERSSPIMPASARSSPRPATAARSASPVKVVTHSDMLPPPLPKSAMKRPDAFAFATPASPVRAATAVAIPSSPNRRGALSPTLASSPARSSRGPLPTRPPSTVKVAGPSSPIKVAPTTESYSRPMTRQASASSLKRTSAILVKKPSTRSLRSNASPTPDVAAPPELDASSGKSSPEVDAARTPPLHHDSPSSFADSSHAAHAPSSPRKSKSPMLGSARSTGDLRRAPSTAVPARRNTVVLPSVRSKVAALESRQSTLHRLSTAAGGKGRPHSSHTTLERADSIASEASEVSFAMGLGRANSMASFRAPLFREEHREV